MTEPTDGEAVEVWMWTPGGHHWVPRSLSWDEQDDPARRWRCAGCAREATIPLLGDCPALSLDLDGAA